MLRIFIFFFFNDTATTEIYTLSLHDALPILPPPRQGDSRVAKRRPAVGGGDREIHEARAEPSRGVTRRDRRKREQGVILHRRDRPPDAGRRAAVHRGPARWRLLQRGAVAVGPERHDPGGSSGAEGVRSEEHTSELQSRLHLVCRLLLEKKKNKHDRASDTATS